MKTLLATALLCTTTSLYAHDACDVELDGGINIDSQQIEFKRDQQTRYKIINDRILMVNGAEINLDSNQQSLVFEYASSIRNVVPEVQNIALDGIDLAIDGVNMAFNELLGDGNDVSRELTDALTHVRVELETHFDTDKGFYFDDNGFDGGDFLGEDFEQRIESMVENAVKNSMGSLLVAVGQELLFSGGNMDTFETRMQDFGHKIEFEMESRAEKIEQGADKICLSIVNIDKLEEQLKAQIPALSDINVLTQNSHITAI
jgi:hypothetical protein